ncbi:uncharacterized protein TRIADDRAFT_25636 [Trichoplax adhaerens]|uniref:cysteine--tRNA ligase n=1 Tax=Trichoplax adhaerens TaxID=10228 RepID=B3RYL2_TRIAD|nr:hypothetical protein TRIADDRAFT_25636 [Trichoplax adhaerens]EDV25060.1 hypothetical protein TRIADDRAFT_25636 [Trichoplax adhaerens]|eukprot:XP_002112950.1 hypothetical protein TRIADDRAFT_25636 [Trichoplax adhaerens]
MLQTITNRGRSRIQFYIQHHCRRINQWIQPTGYDTGIKVYNSLTNSKVSLILPQDKLATWYMCGPTVYDSPHLGHASSYVKFDIIRRIMTDLFDIDIVMVMGITDIDDKIVQRAADTKTGFRDLARKYEKEFLEDMECLNVLRATRVTRVTEHIDHIIKFIEKIFQHGYAYKTSDGSVYFYTEKYGDRYGKLAPSRQTIHKSIDKATDSEKISDRDFALWKAAKADEPCWQSPWGSGRPGWHIECSAMSSAIFGNQLDIHTGGIDLLFPHHENEIAQCEAYHQINQWTNYFLHTGHLHIAKEKMSKSLRNFVTIKDYLNLNSPDQFRTLCLLSKYRSPTEYNSDIFKKAEVVHQKFSSYINDAKAYVDGSINSLIASESEILEKLAMTKSQVRIALADDFDTPTAINYLLNLLSFANVHSNTTTKSKRSYTARSPSVIAAVSTYVEKLLSSFGLSRQDDKRYSPLSESVVDSVVGFRSNIRNYALDKLKNRLKLPSDYESSKNPDCSYLLDLCDNYRNDLLNAGIIVKVCSY